MNTGYIVDLLVLAAVGLAFTVADRVLESVLKSADQLQSQSDFTPDSDLETSQDGWQTGQDSDLW